MQRNYKDLEKIARKLLFEDSYPEYSQSSWADGDRAGTQFVEDEPEDSDPALETPVVVDPQMPIQLSADMPPVDDPTYVPVNAKELSRALSVLAQRLPDDVVEKTYIKFQKFVDDHEVVNVEVIDNAGEDSPDEEIDEVRRMIRNKLIVRLLSESWDEFELAGHEEDDDDWDGPSDEDLEAIDRGDPHAGEMTLGQIAKEMGMSVSGAKRLEAEALKNYRLVYDVAPEDMDRIIAFSVPFFADALVELDLITPEDGDELKNAPDEVRTWGPMREFIWSWLNNVHKKMYRDAEAAGLDPTKQLAELQPGLYDRAKAYFDGLPRTKLMQNVVDAMMAAP